MKAWDFVRPFTLLPPAVGMISGALSAVGSGATPAESTPAQWTLGIILGALMAASLNGASNGLNQIFDLALDRINKPQRPLVTGAMKLSEAWGWTLGLFAMAVILAASIRPVGRPEVLVLVLIAAIFTWAYSAPPLRLRNSCWWALLVIAVPRGALLKVCGWASVATLADGEPWFLRGIFFFFLLGTAGIKDFADMQGDAAGGVVTLPIRFTPRGAAKLMAPFFVLPWIGLAVLPQITWAGLRVSRLHGGAAMAVGSVLATHGFWVARHLIRHSDELTDSVAGARAWRHLYWLMMEAQVLVAAAYFV